jgi:hypothetical protein
MDPCIYKSTAQDRSKYGRSHDPGSNEAMGELESPRLDRSRSRVRTVARTGSKPGPIAQGGIRSAHREGQTGGQGVYVGVDGAEIEPAELFARPAG